MDDFERELKTGFLEEASQLIADAEQCFLLLESSPNDKSILEKIFRLAHNLKGSSKAVGFDGLGEFTHQFESYLLKLKDGHIQVQRSSVSLLLRCNDHIQGIVDALKTDFDAKADNVELLAEIAAHMSGNTAETPSSELDADLTDDPIPSGDSGFESEEVPFHVETARPAVPQANSGMNHDELALALEAETNRRMAAHAEADRAALAALPPQNIPDTSSTAPPNATHQLAPQAAPVAAPPAHGGSGSPHSSTPADESIRVSLSRLEKLLNFVGEMVILQTVLKEQAQSSESPLLRRTVHQLGKVTKEVQDISMSLRMVPLKQTFQKMQRIVRDTSSALDKKVHLKVLGDDTEVDKTILESLGDPLVHLIRNAVDHGIERTETRIANGKPESGTVELRAFHESGSLIIEVQDDGAGLDPNRLRAKAIEKGVIKANAILSDKEAYDLIFSSGFSTKAVVTDVSGRGVGMDVVKTNIEHLQGELSIQTELGKGTCFRVRLPLTLAIIDGMIIQSDNERYVIPLSHVFESLRPQPGDVHFATGLGEILSLRGENLPMFHLNQLLNKKAKAKAAADSIAIVVRTAAQPFSILVDDILGQHQVVVKQLGQEHKDLKGFGGSTILGDGRPSIILELPELVTNHSIEHKNPETRKKSA